jgi:hypothetical protein
MKNLYSLNDEEKQRILNLHENVGKKQYLSEDLETAAGYAALGAISGAKTLLGITDKAIADPTKKAERIKNISKIVCSLKGDVINNKDSQFNGKSWTDYVTRFNITSTEEAEAKKLCATGGDARLYNIAKIACSVDASGKINNPNSKHNNKMFTDYIRTYKLSGEEVAKAKQLCGKLGKPKQPADSAAGSTKGSTTKETLSPRIQNVQKSLGVKNPTGQLDVASLQTILAKLGGQTTTPVTTTTTVQPTPASLTPQQMVDTMNKLINKPQ